MYGDKYRIASDYSALVKSSYPNIPTRAGTFGIARSEAADGRREKSVRTCCLVKWCVAASLLP
jgi:hypothetical protein